MIKHILLLESDKTFADYLREALHRLGTFTISTASNLKEACLLLIQQPQDLAFIPVSEGEKTVRSLRAVQPDLPLILLTPTADFTVPPTYSGKVQAVLIKPLLAIDLPIVLQQIAGQPIVVEESMALEEEKPPLDTTAIRTALHKVNLGRLIQAAILAQGTSLLAHWGDVNESEAATVAWYVGEGWTEDTPKARVQFMHLPARAGAILLYTRRVTERHLLTLIAAPEAPLSELRLHADDLAAVLAGAMPGKASREGSVTGMNNRKSYAIIWRPVRPLPTSLHIPLRRAIERLAMANACVLTYITVQAELVHLVVNCPPDRDNVWLAYLFKNGSEENIQEQYGVSATLWDTGFYATESADPLSEAELNIFLERDRSR
jgi:CheY-like chemotaxis protein